MAPLILVHIGLIFYAMRHDLTAAEILTRTQGSVFWGAFYGCFVLLAATHGSIGVRNVLAEWAPVSLTGARVIAVAFGVLLVALGLRAVAAVVL